MSRNAIVLGLLLSSACTVTDKGPMADTSPPASSQASGHGTADDGGPVATGRASAAAPGGIVGGATAALNGRLALHGACLGVDTGDRLVQPVFPSGTVTWDAQAKTLVCRNQSYRLGDSIRLGGVYRDRSAVDMLPGAYLPACDTDQVFGVS